MNTLGADHPRIGNVWIQLLYMNLLLALRMEQRGIGWRNDDDWIFFVDRHGVRRTTDGMRINQEATLRELRALIHDESEPADAGRFRLLVGERGVTVAVRETVESSDEVTELWFEEGFEEIDAESLMSVMDLLRDTPVSFEDCTFAGEPGEAGISPTWPRGLGGFVLYCVLATCALAGYVAIVASVTWHYLEHGVLPN